MSVAPAAPVSSSSLASSSSGGKSYCRSLETGARAHRRLALLRHRWRLSRHRCPWRLRLLYHRRRHRLHRPRAASLTRRSLETGARAHRRLALLRHRWRLSRHRCPWRLRLLYRRRHRLHRPRAASLTRRSLETGARAHRRLVSCDTGGVFQGTDVRGACGSCIIVVVIGFIVLGRQVLLAVRWRLGQERTEG